MAKRGRPKLNDIHNKEVRVEVRMSKVERTRLETVADFYKTSKSDAIRMMINREMLSILEDPNYTPLKKK